LRAHVFYLMKVMRTPIHVVLGMVLAAAGCAGAVVDEDAPLPPDSGGPGGNDSRGGSGGSTASPRDIPEIDELPDVPPVASGDEAKCDGSARPGPRLLRRLTGTQLEATLAELFGDNDLQTGRVLDDPLALGFRVDAQRLVVRDLGSQQLLNNAEAVAERAVAQHLDKFIDCQDDSSQCFSDLVQSFGKKAFRRPLKRSEEEAYVELARAEDGFKAGAEAIIATMLQSPHFLYRSEIGEKSGERYELTQHEIASNIAYLVTGTLPDDELITAADEGKLSSSSERARHIDRLLKKDAAKDVLWQFADGWLGLDHLDTTVKDDSVFELTDDLRDSMREESRRFFIETFEEGGTFKDLLTAQHSFLDRRLAEHYQVPGGSDTFDRVDLPQNKRAGGILSHGGLLTGYATSTGSSPVKRGILVRARLLCDLLPDPPASLDTMLPDPIPGQTTRERFTRHSELPACKSCHALIDPVGFGFEHYDGFGRRRESENGKPIDATGNIAEYEKGEDAQFEGLGELAQLIADSPRAQTCLVRYWSYFAYGLARWEEDACTYRDIRESAKKEDFSLSSVFKAIADSPHFTTRSAD